MAKVYFTIGKFNTEKMAQDTLLRLERVIDGSYKTRNPVIHAIHRPKQVSLAEVMEILGMTWIENDKKIFWTSMDDWSVVSKKYGKTHWVKPWFTIRAPMWTTDEEFSVTFDVNLRCYD